MSEAVPPRTWHRIEGVDPASITAPTRVKAGTEAVVLVKTPTGFRAIERACPHQQATMTDAIMMGNGTIVRCPRHNFAFRLSDGKGVNCAGLFLKVYEVREVEGGLEVAV